jgi:NAD(P)-dependent dehydrogenase (short-subunit alcohol dehydrogenase family)
MKQEPNESSVDLAGQVALVTGGGRGIGRACVLALSAAGAKVAIVSRTSKELDETAAAGAIGRVFPFPADVTDLAAMREVVTAVRQQIGPIDLLVNNAGMATPYGPVTEIDPDAWWRCIEVNLRGPMNLCRLILPDMIARGRGRIINVASGTGTRGIPNISAYVASKAALIQFSECLANETGAAGIHVFAIQPGTIRTAMAEDALTSETGRKWLPGFKAYFDQGQDVSVDVPARLVLFLAAGHGDALSGRFIDACTDYATLAKDAARVQAEDLLVMRYRAATAPS